MDITFDHLSHSPFLFYLTIIPSLVHFLFSPSLGVAPNLPTNEDFMTTLGIAAKASFSAFNRRGLAAKYGPVQAQLLLDGSSSLHIPLLLSLPFSLLTHIRLTFTSRIMYILSLYHAMALGHHRSHPLCL